MMSLEFPIEGDVCERCGYPLHGVAREAVCPECGQSVERSDPGRRVGLPWQNRSTPGGYLATVTRLVLRGQRSFDVLRLGGGLLRERVFLLINAALCGAVALLLWRAAGYTGGGWLALMMAGGAAGMTYVEAAGVAYVGRRDGWRLGWREAERVACYASVGWPPAGAVIAKVLIVQEEHMRTGFWPRWWPQAWFPASVSSDVIAVAVIACGAVMGFELLVWLGVQRVRYGNRR
jgi:predicted RNA-binding Zn-ribbon protein involved in translation (DUF1610 family)